MTKVDLTSEEVVALSLVMQARLDNVVETRQQTGDGEYDEDDEAQCQVLAFMLTDFDFDPDAVASLEHLYDAIWIALDTPDAFEGVSMDALRSAAPKVGYDDERES
jgi:hypothetical protein